MIISENGSILDKTSTGVEDKVEGQGGEMRHNRSCRLLSKTKAVYFADGKDGHS